MADPEVGLSASFRRTSQEDKVKERFEATHADSKGHASDLTVNTSGEDPIQWRYLTWESELPPPAFLNGPDADRTSRTDFPSPSSYEQIISPFEWSQSRKTFITWLSCAATAVTAFGAGSYTAGDAQMQAEWSISHVVVTIGVTMFTCGFGIAPMVLAPFSEINGRRPVFVVTGVLFVAMQLCCALTPTFAGMLVARFLTGCFSSTFSTMVGGVVADIYRAEDRNTAMALFSGAALFGTGLGPLVSGFVAAHTTWRWIFYLQVITCGALMACVVFFFKETRGSVLLSRKAAAINKYYEALEKHGVLGVDMPLSEDNKKTVQRIRWRCEGDEERTSIHHMIAISLYRPFHMLFTEPTVFWFSAWVSFSWAVLYLTFGAIPVVFETHHDFNLEQTGGVFTALCVAAILSTIISIFAERIQKKHFPRLSDAPEGRLYFACIQSILLPIGLFWFGWSSFRGIPWIVPTLAIGCATMGIFSIYLATFNYLADVYHKYASSALAAQSFCRNMLGGSTPLFTDQMFDKLTYQGAGSLLGGIGLVLTAVPFVLILYGPRIRRRSKFASEIMDT